MSPPLLISTSNAPYSGVTINIAWKESFLGKNLTYYGYSNELQIANVSVG